VREILSLLQPQFLSSSWFSPRPVRHYLKWKDYRSDASFSSARLRLNANSYPPTSFFNREQRIAYVYRAQRAIKGSKVRIIWGKVTRPHGNSGVVRGKFTTNLPPRCFGASCRVVSSLAPENNKRFWTGLADSNLLVRLLQMLYPSNI
jgi:large subunit ribosomal protein L35Ae